MFSKIYSATYTHTNNTSLDFSNCEIYKLKIDKCFNSTKVAIKRIASKINPTVLEIYLSRPGMAYWN